MLKIFVRAGLIYCSTVFAFSQNKVDKNTVPDPIQSIMFSPSPIDLQGIEAKFVKDIPYDKKGKTKFDIWLPESKTPTGLLMYTHGGGFIGGDKDLVQKKGKWDFPSEIRTLLSNNIAVASVNYSFLEAVGETEGVLKPMNDVKRALQYIRGRASDFNIDKSKIVLGGNSAGAGISLWIATNNNMADPNNIDPVLRESTRVSGIALRETQSTYNIQLWIDDVFVDYGLTFDQLTGGNYGSKVAMLYGISSIDYFHDPETIKYREKVDMLSLLTADDPDIWVNNTLTDVSVSKLNHHAYHARAIKERADSIGVPIVAYYGKDPLIYGSPSKESWVDFIIRNSKIIKL